MEVENRLCCRPQCCPGFFNLLKTMKFWNGICAIVIFLLVILHMVCIGGPYFSGLLINGHTLKEISSAVSDAANESYDSSDSMSQFSETMTFGLWEMCIYTSNNSVDASDCITWGTTSSLLETPTTITIGGWIHGVQALAIIGTLFAGFGPIFAFFSLICESRDDRQRFCFLIISALCIIGGIAMLIGDIIMGVMYKTILESVVEGVPLESDMDVPATLIDLLKDKMYLSWGFTSDICCSGVAMLYGIVIVIIIKGKLISVIAPSGDATEVNSTSASAAPEPSSSQTTPKGTFKSETAPSGDGPERSSPQTTPKGTFKSETAPSGDAPKPSSSQTTPKGTFKSETAPSGDAPKPSSSQTTPKGTFKSETAPSGDAPKPSSSQTTPKGTFKSETAPSGDAPKPSSSQTTPKGTFKSETAPSGDAPKPSSSQTTPKGTFKSETAPSGDGPERSSPQTTVKRNINKRKYHIRRCPDVNSTSASLEMPLKSFP